MEAHHKLVMTQDPKAPSVEEVEPGGETGVKRDRSATHEDADATADGRAEEMHQDVLDEAERSMMH